MVPSRIRKENMPKLRLDNDKWEDAGMLYDLISIKPRPDSTAVELTLECDGEQYQRVVAYHQIDWIEE